MGKSGLGKGLSALISSDTISDIDQGYIPKVPVNKIVRNRFQPRIEFEEEKIKELAESIKEHGIIEPLIVTKKDKDTFELIAGERRLQASRKAGMKTVPVVLKEASEQQMLELAVVENVQRADLNPLEEGLAFEQLSNRFNMSHADISHKVGISRSAVANKIRLLNLPQEIKTGLLKEDINEGHARALLGLTSENVMLQTYKKVVKDNMSVRSVEELVRRLNKGNTKIKTPHTRILDEKTTTIENNLRSKFTKKVKLSRSKKGGKITIPFKNDEELDDLYTKLMGQK